MLHPFSLLSRGACSHVNILIFLNPCFDFFLILSSIFLDPRFRLFISDAANTERLADSDQNSQDAPRKSVRRRRKH